MATPHAGPEKPNTKADHDAATACAEAKRPLYKWTRWWAAGLLLVIVIGGAGCEAASEDSGGTGSDNTSQDAKSDKKKKSAAKEEPEMTSGQENALEAAQNYIDIGPFSKAGLIQQLSSSAGDGYSRADATFAANHVDADWNAEAVEAAKNYLDISSFSKQGLIEQVVVFSGRQVHPGTGDLRR